MTLRSVDLSLEDAWVDLSLEDAWIRQETFNQLGKPLDLSVSTKHSR